MFISKNTKFIPPSSRHFRRVFITFTLTCNNILLSAHAADELPNTVLPTITITATKSPTAVKNTIAQTTVFDEQQLQRYQGQSVLDVLKQQSGFSAFQYGGDGSPNNFYLRGFNSSQVLVLIDGIRYGSLSTGRAALQFLPVEQIDRIEVLHGASGSSLYGADAMGGVIQIFTKGHNATQSNTSVTLGAGSEQTYQTQASGQYVNANTTVSLAVGHEKTDGINATLPTNSDYFRDKDGFASQNVSLFAKHHVNDTTEIGITGLYTYSKTDYDSNQYDANYLATPYINTYSKQKNGAINAFANYQKDNFTGNLKFGESIDNSTFYDSFDPTGTKYDTKQQQVNLQLAYDLAVGKIIGGTEWLKQGLDGSNTYSVNHRTIKSGFIGYQIANNNYDFQAHVRHDDNSQFNNKTTYNIGGAYRIFPNTRVGASYATGFRAPTLNDLYARSSYFTGNPNLKAETSKNSEVFIENSTDKQTTRLTSYHSDIKDGINYTQDYSTMTNIDKSKINGTSLTSDWQIHHTLFGINYDYQKATNERTDKQLTYHPNHTALAYLGYRIDDFDIRSEVTYTGKRYTDESNNKRLDSYTLLNLSGSYYINPNLTVSARLNNLTDKKYETIKGYNNKGINSFVSITYKWF